MDHLKRIQESKGIFGRSVRGGVWLGAGSTAEQGLRFVRNMVLARLLAPEAFGLMAIVISVCSLFQVLTGLGIKEAIVQNPRGAERTFLNGAWWLTFVRGVVLYLAALGAAPWLARFYESPELSRLLPVAFVSVLAQGALSAGAYVTVKRMQYAKWVMVQQGGSLIGIATTLGLAFWLKGVWALVIGYATEGVARCLISYLTCPFKPDFKFEREDLRSLFHFAKGMFGLPILMLVYSDGIVFAVGKLCTKEQLGIFAMALTLARVPGMFSNQLVDLLMPAFSEMQKEPRRVSQGILKATTLAVLFGLPATCFAAIYGQQILSVVYGQRYAEGAMVLTFFTANELLMVCSVPIAAVYMAMGQPALLRRFSIIRAILVLVLFWPLISYWGIVGAALVPWFGMFVAFGFQLYRLRSVTGLDVPVYLAIWLRGFWVAIGCSVFWLMIAPLLLHQKPVVTLVGVVVATALAVALCASIAWRKNSVRKYFWPFASRLG